MTGPTGSPLGSDQAPSMDCHEVQEALAAPPRAVSLTEWALVHAHVASCPDCQKQRESVQPAVSSQRVEPSRGPGVSLIGRARALATSTARHVPMLVTPAARPVAISIERTRLVIARVPVLLTGLRSPLAIGVQGTARGVREAAGAGATRVLGLVTRLGVLTSTSLTVSTRAVESTGAAVARVGRRMPSLVTPSVRAAGHVVGRAWLAITDVPHVVIRLRSSVIVALRGPARAAGQAAGAGVACALGVLGRLGVMVSTLARSAAQVIGARPRAYAAVAGVTVLVASLLFLWPRQWSDDLGPRFSGRERISPEASAPVVRTPVGPSAPMPVAVTSPTRPGVGTPPPPVAAARPQSSPVTVPHPQAEIPAPVRRRVTASVPPPSPDAPQSAETSDPAAAIDWLLKGGNGRRQTESP